MKAFLALNGLFVVVAVILWTLQRRWARRMDREMQAHLLYSRTQRKVFDTALDFMCSGIGSDDPRVREAMGKLIPECKLACDAYATTNPPPDLDPYFLLTFVRAYAGEFLAQEVLGNGGVPVGIEISSEGKTHIKRL